MEIRRLRYFVAVAEELNFTRAAQRLHIAQPSLSVQIRKLESEVSVPLLLREGRNIRLSEAGRVFLGHARQLLERANLSVTLAQQAAHGEIGHLSIGYNTAAEFRVFPQVVPAFKKGWPRVHLTFHSFKIAEQLDALRRDEIDVGFIWLPASTSDLDVQALTEESLVAVLPARHPLASAPSVSIRDLSTEPLILFRRTLDPETYHQIEELFAREGSTMNVAYELETLLSVINFVAMGSACSILADYTRRIRWDALVYKPLKPAHIVKTLAMVKKKGRGDLAESFYRFTAQCLSDDMNASTRSSKRRRASASGR